MEDNTSLEEKRERAEQLENERLLQKEYNRELRKQQYKQLMHFLDRSKIYISYIVDKIGDSTKKKGNKIAKWDGKNDVTNENTSPQEKKKKVGQSYDIQNYIPQEEMKDELLTNSDSQTTEASNIIRTPMYFNGDLREYQKVGFQWLKVLYEYGVNGILADEMGLGKTVQVIALLCHLIEKEQAGPYLIIAPLSTIPNWMIEFERFAPDLPVVVLYGSRDERSFIQRKIKQKHEIAGTLYSTLPIVLTTFEVLLAENTFLKSLNWRYIIIDEGLRIMSHECLFVKILRTCNAMNSLILTGTLMQNNLAESWSLLKFLLPEIFYYLGVFDSFVAKELEYNKRTKKFLKLEEETPVLSTLREMIHTFILRREKSDVCLDIPQKKELVVYAPLTNLQRDLYTAVLNRDIDTLTKTEELASLILETKDGSRPRRRYVLNNIQNGTTLKLKEQETPFQNAKEISNGSSDLEIWKHVKPAVKNDLSMWERYTSINDRNQEFFINIQLRNILTMYKKIANHPYLVYCPLDHQGSARIDEELVKSSGKLLTLDAMLPKLKERGHKILLFSTMTAILDMIEDYLYLRNYSFVRLDDKTSLEDRKENINHFNTDPNIFMFLISTRAGGVGLNLPAADTVIMYDSDWNPQMDVQAVACCHRIGQKRPVVVYKLCTKGTIDEVIVTREEAKRFLEKMVVSEKVQTLNLNNKQTLIELQKLLNSKECQVATSKNEAFTEEELEKLLDRSDISMGPQEL